MGEGLGAGDFSKGGRCTLGGEETCCTLGDWTMGGISTLGVGSAGTDGGRGGRRRDNGVGGGGGNGGIGGNIVGRGDGGGSELVLAPQSLAGHNLVPSFLGAGTLVGAGTGAGAGTSIPGLEAEGTIGHEASCCVEDDDARRRSLASST